MHYQLFWKKLNEYVIKQNPEEIEPSDIVNKLVAECSMAIENNVILDKKSNNPFINKVKIDSMKDVNEELHCGTGLFYELEISKFEDLLPNMTKKHQTLAYYGFSKEELNQAILNHLPRGLDRLVPIGKSLDFSYIWDGYDLFKSFSREIEII